MKKVNLGVLRGMSLSRATQYAASKGFKLRILTRDGRIVSKLTAEEERPDRVNVHVSRNHVTSVAGIY